MHLCGGCKCDLWARLVFYFIIYLFYFFYEAARIFCFQVIQCFLSSACSFFLSADSRCIICCHNFLLRCLLGAVCWYNYRGGNGHYQSMTFSSCSPISGCPSTVATQTSRSKYVIPLYLHSAARQGTREQHYFVNAWTCPVLHPHKLDLASFTL